MLFCLQVYAQEKIEIETSSNSIGEGDYVEVTYRLNSSKVKNFNPGKLDGLQIVNGPSTSQNTTIVNGKISSFSTYNYYMQPTKTGTVSISGATAIINGKKVVAPKKTIKVTKVSPADKKQIEERKKKKKLEDLVWIQIETEKDTVYKGEQTIVKYMLYTLYQVKNLNMVSNPSLSGFWKHDMNEGKFPQFDKVIDGKKYRVAEIKKFAVFPQRSGVLELDQLEVEAIVRVLQNKRQHFDPFADMFDDPIFSNFGSTYRNVTTNIKSNSDTLVVLPLPAPKDPEAYTGAVGQFTVGANINPRNIKTDEAATISLMINGTGNLKLIDQPKIDFPEGLEVYDVQRTENIYDNSGLLRGSTKFEYPVIPRKPGRYTIPRINFEFFNPEVGKFQEFGVGPYSLNVTPGENYDDNQSTFDETAYELKPLLEPSTKMVNLNTGNYALSMGGIALSLLSLCLFPLIAFVRRKQEENRPSATELKKSAANKIAIQRLQTADKHLSNNDNRLFYDEVIKAIWGYMRDKFEMPSSKLSKEMVQEALIKNNINEADANQMKDLLAHCELALFAPGAMGELNMNKDYERAVNLISSIEDQLNKTTDV